MSDADFFVGGVAGVLVSMWVGPWATVFGFCCVLAVNVGSKVYRAWKRNSEQGVW